MIRIFLALAIAGLLTAAPASAAIDEKYFVPLAGEPVLDSADVIDDKVEAELNAKLKAFADENGRQMAIVTVPSLHGYDIESFTNEYARFLGIGSKELDDGLVYLIAPNDRKQRIEVGYGLEWSMTDIQSGRTIDIAKPFFREGDFTGGIVAVTNAVLPQITPAAEQRAADERARDAERALKAKYAFWDFLSWLGIAIGTVLAAIASWFVATMPKRRRARQKAAYHSLFREAQLYPTKVLEKISAMSAREKSKTYGSEYDESEIRLNIVKAKGRLIKQLNNPTANERLAALDDDPRLVLEYENPSPQEYEKAVRAQPHLIKDVRAPGRRLIDIALRADGTTIQHIADPSDTHILMALTSAPEAIRYLKEPTAAQMIMALNGNGELLSEIANPSEDMRMAAISTTPQAIRHIAQPTAREIEAALSRDPRTIQYLLEVTNHRQKLDCIRREPWVIDYIDEPSPEMQLVAISIDPETILKIARPTPEAQRRAVEMQPSLAKGIANPTRETLLVLENLNRREREERERQRAEQRRREEARRQREEEEAARRRREESSYSTSGYGYGSSSSSFGSSSSSFSGGGGDFGGGGASGDW